ncbi:hypothetical protein FJZ33_00890 [Candidatus Poribacteria bacterium]|nr:hypothetical protein [Candidatus Poribacteria bacterium]
MEYIYGPGGKVIGSMNKSGSTIRGEHVNVYDENGKYVGFVDDYGTYDESGYRVSTSRMPGLLLRR